MLDERRTINDLVNDGLSLWLKLTAISFDKHGNVKTKAKNCPWQSHTLGELTQGLNESRDLDPTGLTTFMMLRGMVESYLRDIQFSAETLILNPASIESQIVPMRAVRDVLENPDVVRLIAEFQQQLRDAALHYGVKPGKAMDGLEALLDDKYQLALVRRDALLSMRRLEAHQFSQGQVDPAPPKYSTHVYEFWNVNSLLLAMRAQKFGGISVVLIRDPVEALNSYFIFAIRNGLTFTILTDRTKGPHPAYERMTRRPDRELDRRAAQNWFPYDLLDLKAIKDESGKTKQLIAKMRTQLVPIHVEAVPIKPIRDLAPEQFVWTTLLFDLIRDKFWKQNVQLPELSYTGQMVVEPQALVGASGALVKDGLYTLLELPALGRADVTAESTKDQWEIEPTRFNQWMVDRYSNRVPEQVFNPVGAQAKLLLQEKAADPTFLPMVGDEAESLSAKDQRSQFETLSPVSFGVKKDIARDRLWVARVNQMKAIQAFANEEYEREKATILAWYEAALEKNREMLLNAAARGALSLPTWRTKDGHFQGKELKSSVPALKQKSGASWSEAYSDYGFRMPVCSLGKLVEEEVPSRGWRRRTRTIYYAVCAERPDIKASVFTVIHITCPEAIAVVCGVRVEDLPWALQHWYDDAPYCGNSILDRLDPEDWVLHNPWMQSYSRSGVRLDVGIAHCKRSFSARRKALGLPPKTWAEDPKSDA